MTKLISADEGLAMGSVVAPHRERQPFIRVFSLLSCCAQPEGVMAMTELALRTALAVR